MHTFNIAVLMTVHNRVDLTKNCLKALFSQVMNSNLFKVDLTVYLVDDGSTDHTSKIISEEFPQVNLIPGSGKLYWNQGMRLAWKNAADKGHSHFLWLNNDTVLCTYALEKLLNTSTLVKSEAIIIGSCMAKQTSDENEEFTTYGGRCSNGLIRASDEIQVADTFNGNLVLIPESVYKVLGNLEKIYLHSYGDLDYGFRAVRQGISIFVAPGHLAVCEKNPSKTYRNPDISFKKRIVDFFGPKGVSAKQLRHFQKVQKRGIWWVSYLKHFLMVFIPVYENQRATKSRGKFH